MPESSVEHQKYIQHELQKAKEQAADPNTQWKTHDEVWRKTRAILVASGLGKD